MDFSKLTANEKLAVYGAAALIIGGAVGYSYGLTFLGLLAAIAMLVVVFLPHLSAGTRLPGSRGSLMAAVGGVAGVAMALALLTALTGALLTNTNFRDVFFLIAVAGGALMAWAGWSEFQAEGGKWQFGTTAAATGSTAGTDAPPPASANAPAEPVAAADPAAPAQPAAPEEPAAPAEPADDPYATRPADEERRPEA